MVEGPSTTLPLADGTQVPVEGAPPDPTACANDRSTAQVTHTPYSPCVGSREAFSHHFTSAFIAVGRAHWLAGGWTPYSGLHSRCHHDTPALPAHKEFGR